MRNRRIVCRGFIPDGEGGYRTYEELSGTEKKAFGEKAVQRMGDTFNRYASANPKEIPRIVAAAE